MILVVPRATEQTKLLQILGERSPEDAYYQVYYRDGDINVQHRLFSWRPHVEILLPWKLRTAIAGDVNREYSLYF
jgi:CRISPR-associated protein (TIGR03985 family)